MRRRWLWLLLVLVVVDGIVLYRWSRSRDERRYDTQILEMARRHQVDPALIKAVIWQESGFDPAAQGRSGEIGLMQIREPAAREWAAAEKISFFFLGRLRDPTTNIRVGSWYLGKMLNRYHDTDNAIPYALADYNAGRAHVLRWMKGAGKTNSTIFFAQMDFPGTQQYIRSVMARCRLYQQQAWRDGRNH